MTKKRMLKQNNAKELEKLLETEREKLRSFRFRISQGKIKQVKEGKEIRRTIARILTRLTEVGKNAL